MATPVDNAVPLTGNPLIDGLTQGSAWQFSGPRVLTYSFSLNDTPGMQPAWTPALKDAFVRAFTAWSNVANISFVETGSGTIYSDSPADIAIALTGSELQAEGAVALGIFPSPAFADLLISSSGETRSTYRQPEGDIAIDNYQPVYQSLSEGQGGYENILHEIGQALGLKHPHDDGLAGRPTFTQLGMRHYENTAHTVMSYNVGSPAHAATPMRLDVQAIQAIYGANSDYRTGDDVYLYTSLVGKMTTIWDAGGNDTLDFSSGSSGVRGFLIDLRPGTQISESNHTVVDIAYGTVIENVIGTNWDDTLLGNDANNRLVGGGGRTGWKGGAATIFMSLTGSIPSRSYRGREPIRLSLRCSPVFLRLTMDCRRTWRISLFNQRHPRQAG